MGRAGLVGVILIGAIGFGLPAWAVHSATEPLWNAAWITDTQTPDCEWIAALVEAVRANRPKIVLHTGDTRFEWANQCAWREVLALLRVDLPPIEFHLSPGNHDDAAAYTLQKSLSRAATRGIYPIDTGVLAEGYDYYHNRVTADATGPFWPVWNPEVRAHPNWQPGVAPPYRYVFKRGGLRFIVCDCYYSDAQRDWVRDLIVQSDDSAASVLLHHEHTVDRLAAYFEGLEGRHNVRLVLSGHDHNFHQEERCGVTFVTGAGIARGRYGECDAMTLWVYPDRLRLDRYVIAAGGATTVEGPRTIWTFEGGPFSEYRRPPDAALPAGAESVRTEPVTLGPDLIANGDFDNGVWYERYRGWSPSHWYQWFTRGGHVPEHAVGKVEMHPAHSGKEWVRLHMWAYTFRAGILQNVQGVEPCHLYRLTAYGFFQPTGAPQPRARIGLDPLGALAGQFSVDVSRHPAPPYDEGIGDDPKTPAVDGPDFPEDTVWSAEREAYAWERFEVTAEARSPTITAILSCFPQQRPADQPIYEMNWDSVSLREVPWPARRLVDEGALLAPDGRFRDVSVTVQSSSRTAQVVWGTDFPAGASQVLYRFVNSDAEGTAESAPIDTGRFPSESAVCYERAATRHRVEIVDVSIPAGAVGIEVVALSRTLVDGACVTFCSSVARKTLD